MGRKNPVQHKPVAHTAVEASVLARNAENGIKENNERGQAIVGKIREHYSIQEELAIHRKAIKKLLDRAGIVDAEFSEYYAVVEAAKVEVDENQQEHHN